MQIYDLLEKVLEDNSTMSLRFSVDGDPEDVACETLVCGRIEKGCTYLTKEDEPFDDGIIADFVCKDSYGSFVFGYEVESE